MSSGVSAMTKDQATRRRKREIARGACLLEGIALRIAGNLRHKKYSRIFNVKLCP